MRGRGAVADGKFQTMSLAEAVPLYHHPLVGSQRAALYFISCVLGGYASFVLCRLEVPARRVWRNGAIAGAVLLYAFVCEYTHFVGDMEKTYSVDFALFVSAAMFGGAVLSAKRSRGDGELLNRDQTDEWKGWMQFLFLLYHQQHATDLYNLIRVFVSAYVWLTGFGNFSFFYTRDDYSLTRLAQMMWRLNFLVLALMLVMNTRYVLYYIVPLHTSMFLLVYASMRLGRQLNYTEWGARAKIALVAALLFVVWDVPGVFGVVFWPLTPLLADERSSLHEWHFRTFLDHFSALFGMVFAMNFPYLSAWFHSAEQKCSLAHQLALKAMAGGTVLALFAFYYEYVFTLPKLEFNRVNPYWCWIPIVTWVYVRNLIAPFRRYHSELLYRMGKITLETYLLQFHVFLHARQPDRWLPRTLTALVPRFPYLNALVVSFLFICCSHAMFGATLTLRSELLGTSGTDDSPPPPSLRLRWACIGTLAFVCCAQATILPLDDVGLLVVMCFMALATAVVVPLALAFFSKPVAQ